MANTNELNVAAGVPKSIWQYIQSVLGGQTNFGPAQRAQQGMIRHPMLGISPSGGWLDPMQLNTVNESNYLGERGDIANNQFAQNDQLAPLLARAGGNYANLVNAIPFLNASNMGGAGSSGGFPGLGF